MIFFFEDIAFQFFAMGQATADLFEKTDHLLGK